MRRKNVSGLLKTLLQAGLYLVDQPQRVADDVSDRVRGGMDDVSERVRGGLSDLGDHLSDVKDRFNRPDRTLHYVLSFAAGIGVGVGVGLLMAPDSGEETRKNVAEKINRVGDRIKNRADALEFETGT
jgi:YtxH-like protein